MKTAKNPILTACLSSLCLIGTFASSAAHADVVRTRIFRVQAPNASVANAPGADAEVLATADGRVYFAPAGDAVMIAKLQKLAGDRTPVTITTDAEGERITAVAPLTAAEAATYADDFSQPAVEAQAHEAIDGAMDAALGSESGDSARAADATPALPLPRSMVEARSLGYDPTILASLADMQQHFRSERELKHKSQCYERAEVWTREMEQSFGTRSMKVFMFFTDRFRSRFTHHGFLGFGDKPYKWWFHVAPFVYVQSANGPQEYVLDREFLSQGVPMNDWTFEFIGKVKHDNKEVANPSFGEAMCRDAAAYTEYSKSDSGRYCVLRKVPMYYFEPFQLENLDTGAHVSGWDDWALKQAYKHTNND